MKIAIVAPIWISVPPKNNGFGAQEYLIYQLAEGLKNRGHEITLFASGDSQTSTKLVSVTPKQIIDHEFPDIKIKDVFELMNLEKAFSHPDTFDIIHNHVLPYGLLFTEFSKVPIVHTLHHVIYDIRADWFIYDHHKSQNYISISRAQQSIFPSLNYISMVYNGININDFAYKDTSSNYLLYIGRMKKYKGIHTAIEVAKQLGIPLKIATPLPVKHQPDYEEVWQYWKTEIEPHIGENIEFFDTVNGPEKVALYQNAKALLFPVERSEPFGMTVIESLACGTPVIAYDNGALSEIIVDRKTGYLIKQQSGVEGLKQAVTTLFQLPGNEYTQMRKNARSHVEQYFSIDAMIEGYEQVYKKYAIDRRYPEKI